jgi:hypothetical protein
MALIPVGRNQYAIVDDDDYEFLMQWEWHAELQRNAAFVRYYVMRMEGPRGDSHRIYMHREILKAPKGILVDHGDGDGLNNRRSNIRLATKSNNQWNRGPSRRNTSGHKGITWDKSMQKWKAALMHTENGSKRTINIGRYESKEEALRAYRNVAMRMRGEFFRCEPFSMERR